MDRDSKFGLPEGNRVGPGNREGERKGAKDRSGNIKSRERDLKREKRGVVKGEEGVGKAIEVYEEFAIVRSKRVEIVDGEE